MKRLWLKRAGPQAYMAALLSALAPLESPPPHCGCIGTHPHQLVDHSVLHAMHISGSEAQIAAARVVMGMGLLLYVPPNLWYWDAVQSAARPSLSALLKGLKGMSLRCSGTWEGPQPSGLSWITGTGYAMPMSCQSSLSQGKHAPRAHADTADKQRASGGERGWQHNLMATAAL
jgi:hypothetical protein